MTALVLALLLGFAPPDGGEAPEQAEGAEASDAPAEAEEPAAEPEPAATPELRTPIAVTLQPTEAAHYVIRDGADVIVYEGALGPDRAESIQLAPGLYSVWSDAGVVTTLAVQTEPEASGPLVWDGDRTMTLERAQRLEAERLELLARAQQAQAQAEAANREDPDAARQAKVAARKRWAAPLASTLIPGAGQFVNGQGGKGTGLLFGTVGSLAGAILLYNTPTDGTRPVGLEYLRLGGFGLLSSTAAILWIYAIADAYEVATDATVEPVLDHKLRVGVSHGMSVGFRADVNRPAFYDEWTISFMGQATRRLSVGVSDLGVKFGTVGDPRVWQFGARLDYRVFDERRLWIDLGLGVAMQVVSSDPVAPLDPNEAVAAGPDRRFGATPYGVLDLRYFVLDRLSLDFSPRLSVPATTRYYSANRAVPALAPMLEMGVGSSLYF